MIFTTEEALLSELQTGIVDAGLEDKSMILLFLEQAFVIPVSRYLIKHFHPSNFIITVLGNPNQLDPKDMNIVFDCIDAGSAQRNIDFYFSKLRHEISQKNKISFLQYEVTEFYEIGKSLSSQKDTMKLFEMIIRSSMNLTSSDAGTLYLVVDKDTGLWSSVQNNCYENKLLKFVIAKNFSMDLRLEASTSPITKKSIFGYTVITGKSLRIENAYDIDPNADYRHDSSYNASTGYITKSILSIPMIGHQNNILGVIQLINKKKSRDQRLDFSDPQVFNQIIPYDETDELLMNSIGGQAAVALENNLLYREMQNLLNIYKEQNETLTYLSRKVLKAHEEERNRIARDIHDGPAQSAANLALTLEICKKLLKYGKHEELIEQMNILSNNIRSTVKEIRSIIYNLKPTFLDNGLFKALDTHITVFSENTGIPASFSSSGDDSGLEYYISSTIYRIVQEGLSNIAKHAQAHKVEVDLQIKGQMLHLRISDDGKGFDPSQIKQKKPQLEGGFGLQGIEERVELVKGTMDIQSTPGKGTTIKISIPLG